MSESTRRARRADASRTRAALGVGLGLILTWAAAPGPARADRISLRGGGVIRGKLIPDPADPGRLTFIGEAGRTPIIYKKEQILQVTPEKSALDEYVARRASERSLAEEEYQLGAWCEENRLRDLALNHYEAALKLDPQHAPAHEKLGHTLVDDRWLDADALKEAQGMVKYRGRWMQPEEKDRLEDQAALAAENQSWTRRVRIYRESLLAGPEARAKDAERRLLAIREAAAVGAVARVLGEDGNPIVRELAGRVLGAIPGPEAGAALVGRLLAESVPEVRGRVVAEVARREPEEVVPRLVRALKSPRPEVINRAAFGLSQLNARSAVPQLIPALVSIETRTVMVPVGNAPGGGLGSVAPTGGMGFTNYSGSAYLGLTPPVVAPGVVAFGSVGVPLGSGVSLGGGGVAVGGIGGGNGAGNGGMIPRVVTIEHPNTEVLAALVKLTGQDFGYDAATWKRWATSFRSEPAPGRRVVQP